MARLTPSRTLRPSRAAARRLPGPRRRPPAAASGWQGLLHRQRPPWREGTPCLHAADAALVAALVLVFGVGLPLCCFFKRGCALYEFRKTRARNARLAAAEAEFEKVGSASEWTQAKAQAQAPVPPQHPHPPAFFGRAAPASAAQQNL